jgi:non-ribosomal peptide synthetase component F
MFSLAHIGIFNKTDVVMQIASSTFDAHVLEILGALVFSATVVMLHPYGNIDLAYLIPTLQKKQVTYILAVPAFVKELCEFIRNRDKCSLASIRSFCSGG